MIYLIPGSCFYEGSQYANSEEVKTSDPCNRLLCVRGNLYHENVYCLNRMNPELWVCAYPVLAEDQCCLACPSGGK